ncbi:Arylamine n-acetyltransferase 1 [Mycena sanguinolenta]|uniref:Arylamine n-acetyltransferase 1 n=1 Tax=Mycena sanguinolenta TaxID=230812 RepID=A0A8H6XNY5_9AGAR|nr:Arylamine n-acetyltransferase 1 [Mycena sanguinolenta]
MAANPEDRGKLRDGLWIKRTSSVYSPAQISRWLSKIQYPGDIPSFQPSLDSLCLLVRLSLTTFPFENTPLHYTAAHDMDITYEGLYKRLVETQGGNGFYCFGVNGLLFQMLKGLGFRVYTGSGRINEQAPGVTPIFHAFVHMILFVQPIEGSNTTYLVDVGSTLVRPILLAEGETVMGASTSEQHTLTRDARTDSSLESSPNSQTPQKFEWRLESVQAKDQAKSTRVMYSFIEDEFFEADFKASNEGIVGLTSGFFWENIVCTKYFWMDDSEVREVDEAIDTAALTPLTRYMGRLVMAGDAVRRHIGTRTTVLRAMKTDEERAEALKEFFDIDIPQENLMHIQGRGAELKVRINRD